MKFLSRVGALILKATEIVAGIAPIATMAYPGEAQTIQTVSQDLAQIADIVTKVEVMGQALKQPGPQKLQAAAPLVAQIVLQSSILANHKIDDPVLFQQGCTKLGDGMADVLNSLSDHVETQGKT